MAKVKGTSANGASLQDDWEASDALHTLCRAREIRKNAKLMARVKALAKSKLTEFASLATSDEDGDND